VKGKSLVYEKDFLENLIKVSFGIKENEKEGVDSERVIYLGYLFGNHTF
jgi:hypothetical protein